MYLELLRAVITMFSCPRRQGIKELTLINRRFTMNKEKINVRPKPWSDDGQTVRPNFLTVAKHFFSKG